MERRFVGNSLGQLSLSLSLSFLISSFLSTVLQAPDPSDNARLTFFLTLQNKLDEFISSESEKSRKRIEEFTIRENENLQAIEARTVQVWTFSHHFLCKEGTS